MNTQTCKTSKKRNTQKHNVSCGVRTINSSNECTVPKHLIDEKCFHGKKLFATRIGQNHLVISPEKHGRKNNVGANACRHEVITRINNRDNMSIIEYRINRYKDIFTDNVNYIVMLSQDDGIHAVGMCKD